MFVSMQMTLGVHGGQRHRFPRDGPTGGSEPPDVGAGNPTQVLWRSSVYSFALTHLSRLRIPIALIRKVVFLLLTRLCMFSKSKLGWRDGTY